MTEKGKETRINVRVTDAEMEMLGGDRDQFELTVKFSVSTAITAEDFIRSELIQAFAASFEAWVDGRHRAKASSPPHRDGAKQTPPR